VDNAANGKIAKYNKACVENGLDFMPEKPHAVCNILLVN
jgi:hypothetical protein